jgi:hypothetical protein
MVERNNLSLRETERLVRFLEIYYSLSDGLDNLISDGLDNLILLRITGVFIFCFYPNLIDNINKNRTDAKDFAQLFNIQSWPDIPINYGNSKHVDVIAVMLILHSKIEDPHLASLKPHDKSYWEKEINTCFFANPSFGCYFGKDQILSVLKETFRVLSLEQTLQ